MAYSQLVRNWVGLRSRQLIVSPLIVVKVHPTSVCLKLVTQPTLDIMAYSRLVRNWVGLRSRQLIVSPAYGIPSAG